jgi:selenocysteine-specific elongation factor
VLRDPGSSRALGGAQVLDADPPALRRRGDSARRAAALGAMDTAADLTTEVARRGAVPESHLRRLGLLADGDAEPPAGVRVLDGWWVHAATYDAWRQRLQSAVAELHARDPLADGLSRGAARDLLELPDESLLNAVARDAGLEQGGGNIRVAGTRDDLGGAEAAVSELEVRLRAEPFRAPEADDLSALRLGARELAAAERAGRVLRLRDGVVLLPTAPALAMRALAQLDQPFTTSQARQALNTSRRVAIPLLELLDTRGWTRRLDAGHREVVR